MKHTLFTIITSICAFVATTFAGDFDFYEQVKQAQRERATNEMAQAFLNELTDEQWLQFADEYIATNTILHEANTNYHGTMCISLGTTKDASWLGWKIVCVGKRQGNAKALCDEYDQKFVDAGCWDYFPWDGVAAYFPKMHAYYAAQDIHTNWVNNTRALYVTIMAARDTFNEKGLARGLTLTERINRLVNYKLIGFLSIDKTSSQIKYITSNLVKPIKRKLRERGISFVVEEGEANPVQEAIDALTTAFQTPKLAGVKEWVAEWFPEYQWIDLDDLLKSDEEIAQLCDDIYYGEKDLAGANAQIILTHLGLEEYNKFIERYNGK